MWPFSRARDRPPKLWASVLEVGEVEVILGQRRAHEVKAEIVLGRAPEWIDAENWSGERITVRTANITGLVVSGGGY